MQTHTVQTAADGLEAIERAREFEPEIVFMDLAMPRLGGEDATLDGEIGGALRAH